MGGHQIYKTSRLANILFIQGIYHVSQYIPALARYFCEKYKLFRLSGHLHGPLNYSELMCAGFFICSLVSVFFDPRLD